MSRKRPNRNSAQKQNAPKQHSNPTSNQPNRWGNTGGVNRAVNKPNGSTNVPFPVDIPNATATATLNSKTSGWNQEPPPLTGGRQSQPTNPAIFDFPYQFLPRKAWQGLDLNDIRESNAFNSQQLLDMLSDLSDSVGMATWNTLRMGNDGGWSYEVRTADDTKPHPDGQKKLKEIIPRFNRTMGGMNNIINQLIFSIFLQGAASAELVLTTDLKEVADLVPVQPWTIYFSRDFQTQNLIPYQQQVLSYRDNTNVAIPNAAGTFPFKRLNPTTFTYVPMDPAVDDPYGRAPAAPVLQEIIFDIQFMKDLRQSVHMSAWGRLHIKAVEELLLKNAPAAIKGDPTGEEAIGYIRRRLNNLLMEYEALGPDDAFISTDAINIESIKFDGVTLSSDTIFRIIERRLIRALKQLPVLMASNEGVTETHGTVQMEIYANGVKSIQNIIASIMEYLLGRVLQFYGIKALVKWKFAPVRAYTRMMDAQAEAIEQKNASGRVAEGWSTNDEASNTITGSKAVGKSITLETQKAQMAVLQQQAIAAELANKEAEASASFAPQKAQIGLTQAQAEAEAAKAQAEEAGYSAQSAGHKVKQDAANANVATGMADATLQQTKAQAEAASHQATEAQFTAQSASHKVKQDAANANIAGSMANATLKQTQAQAQAAAATAAQEREKAKQAGHQTTQAAAEAQFAGDNAQSNADKTQAQAVQEQHKAVQASHASQLSQLNLMKAQAGGAESTGSGSAGGGGGGANSQAAGNSTRLAGRIPRLPQARPPRLVVSDTDSESETPV